MNRSVFQGLFYVGWFVVGILQAMHTELLADEAYYWYYASQLEWGYFDHPPMIALLIRLGTLIFPGELGVRLFPLVLQVLTIRLWQLILKPRNLRLFFALIGSTGLLHFLGYLALPDAPLLFFSACFLALYKRFLRRPNGWGAIGLGLMGAGMLLSKYHGLLVIAFVVGSNPRLLRNRFTWMAALVGVLLLFPHAWWQWTHDFPSLRYHLFERARSTYKLRYTSSYLFTQLVIFGPFVGVVFYWAVWKIKARNQFDRALKWQVWGTLLFFFIMTFRGRVEGHWTLIGLFPALIMGYRYLEKQRLPRLWVFRLLPVTLLLILCGRIFLAVDTLPSSAYESHLVRQYHGHREWTQAIRKQAESLPVVFINSYQNAALYRFYGRKEAVSVQDLYGRKNQFSLWQSAEKLQGKKVFVVPHYWMSHAQDIPGLRTTQQYVIDECFTTAEYLTLNVNLSDREVDSADSIRILVELGDDLDAQNRNAIIHYYYLDGKRKVTTGALIPLEEIRSDQSTALMIPAPQEAGKFQLVLGLKSGWMPVTRNSPGLPVVIHEPAATDSASRLALEP